MLTCLAIGNARLMRALPEGILSAKGREGVYLLLSVVLELSLVLDHVLCQLFSLGIPGQCGKCKFKTPTNMKPLLEISGETSFSIQSPGQAKRVLLLCTFPVLVAG